MPIVKEVKGIEGTWDIPKWYIFQATREWMGHPFNPFSLRRKDVSRELGPFKPSEVWSGLDRGEYELTWLARQWGRAPCLPLAFIDYLIPPRLKTQALSTKATLGVHAHSEAIVAGMDQEPVDFKTMMAALRH